MTDKVERKKAGKLASANDDPINELYFTYNFKHTNTLFINTPIDTFILGAFIYL